MSKRDDWILHVSELVFGERGCPRTERDGVGGDTAPSVVVSLPLVPFEFFFNMCCVQTRDNGRTTSSTPKIAIRLFEVCPQRLSSECARPRESFTQKCVRDFRMSQYKCCFIFMSICVSWTNWQVKSAISDAMRDSNSHEFEEIVDPITCIYLMRKLKSVLMRLMRLCRRKKRVLSLHSHGRKCLRNRTSPPSLGVCEHVHTWILHMHKLSLTALSHQTHTLVETKYYPPVSCNHFTEAVLMSHSFIFISIFSDQYVCIVYWIEVN